MVSFWLTKGYAAARDLDSGPTVRYPKADNIHNCPGNLGSAETKLLGSHAVAEQQKITKAETASSAQ